MVGDNGMKQRHANESTTSGEIVSAWWDDEWRGDDAELEALLSDVEGVRSRSLVYERIGSRLRGESLETRDLLDSIDARLDEIPANERPGGGRVISLDSVRARRHRRFWQGAIAASLFAAVTAVGLTLSTGDRNGVEPMQAEGPTRNDRAVMASLNAPEVPEGASPAMIQRDRSPSRVVRASAAPVEAAELPDWATGRGRSGPDPYVMTHYRLASPDFGTTGPEARAATFGQR